MTGGDATTTSDERLKRGIVAVGLTDRGRRRETNEDAFLIADDVDLFIVCDGLGGHAAGEEASRRAAGSVAGFVAGHRAAIAKAGSTPSGYFQCTQLLREAVQNAAQEICNLGRSEQRFAGMATTLTALLLVDSKGVMAHVGDTRLYLERRGRLHLLSTDHTLAEELVRAGTLDPEDAGDSRYSHVLTRSVGAQASVDVETLLFDVQPGDTLLLASDGLTQYLQDDAEVAGYLGRRDLDEAARELVALANSRGGRDNISVVLVRYQGPSETAPQDGDGQRQLEALETAFPYEDLALSRLSRILAEARVRRFDAGQVVVRNGRECPGLWVIVEGRVRVVRADEPAQVLVAGESFGELALLRPRPALASAVAAGPSVLLLVEREAHRRLARRRPRLGSLLTSRLIRRMSQSLERLGPEAEAAAVRRAAWF